MQFPGGNETLEKPNDHTHTTHPLAKVGRRLSQQREEPTKHPTSGDEYQKVQQLLGTLLAAYRPDQPLQWPYREYGSGHQKLPVASG